jgi:1-aminocyclopropane-1-carboxylate deaminase/D-cysteine desulfhydrase-like pyridoxal-dependent ACC family enzyme
MRAHLLVRGERPLVPTGNHLFASMFAHNVVYVPRSEYVDRDAMLSAYMEKNMGSTSNIAVVPEGASEPSALLGILRLVHWMAHSTSAFPRPHEEARLVIDCGTGTTAVGLALGAALLGLPWQVIGVMLAGPHEYYSQQASRLVQQFCEMVELGSEEESAMSTEVSARLRWIERVAPRKFGSILPNEMHTCREIASKWGVIVDPIWTLAAWEAAIDESSIPGSDVLMIHSGGGLGLCGIAQRYPKQF